MTNKSQLAPRGEVHIAQHTQGINSNHSEKNIQPKERHDRPQNFPSASSHLWFRDFPNLKGCLCIEKASTNLSNHLGIYINFINNILGQRFHSSVGCDKKIDLICFEPLTLTFIQPSLPQKLIKSTFDKERWYEVVLFFSQLLFEIK